MDLSFTREIPINSDGSNITFKMLRPGNAVKSSNATLVRVQSFDEKTGLFSCVPSNDDEWLETRGDTNKVLTLPHAEPIIGKREEQYKNIAATSIILTADGFFMFVERADGEKEFERAWELAPSIALTPEQLFGKNNKATLSDIKAPLTKAVVEKIGIRANQIDSPELFAFYEAAECYEPTFLIRVGLEKNQISNCFKETACPEYSGRIKFVKPHLLKDFEQSQPEDKWVSTTRAVLSHLQP